METFSDRLRALRKERDITQQYLAQMLNISINSYSQYELGNTEPKFENLRKIADFFCVTIDYLLGTSHEKNFSQLTDQMSNDEKKLLRAYRSMPDIAKRKIIEDAEFYAYEYEKQK